MLLDIHACTDRREWSPCKSGRLYAIRESCDIRDSQRSLFSSSDTSLNRDIGEFASRVTCGHCEPQHKRFCVQDLASNDNGN